MTAYEQAADAAAASGADEQEREKRAAVPAMTIHAALALRYPPNAWAVFFDVPDNVGVNSRRRADALAFGLWKSVGHVIEGFEFKASRSDWLRELKDVTKADPFIERCDRWWLVTTDAAIAKLEELPACWGWLSLTKSGLRVQKPAPRLREWSGTMDKLFALGVLRKAAEPQTSEELERAVSENRRQFEERVEETAQRRAEFITRENKRLAEKVAGFEAKIGMSLSDWQCEHVAKIAVELAKLSYGADGLDAIDAELAAKQRTLEKLLECLKLARVECGRRP